MAAKFNHSDPRENICIPIKGKVLQNVSKINGKKQESEL
jgi:hypothetical protein